jgi:hypothetical protein
MQAGNASNSLGSRLSQLSSAASGLRGRYVERFEPGLARLRHMRSRPMARNVYWPSFYWGMLCKRGSYRKFLALICGRNCALMIGGLRFAPANHHAPPPPCTRASVFRSAEAASLRPS